MISIGNLSDMLRRPCSPIAIDGRVVTPWYASGSDSLFFNVNLTGDIGPLEVCTFAAVIDSVATGAGLIHVSMSAMMTANVAKIRIAISFLLRPFGLAAQAGDPETDSTDNVVPRASQRGVY